MCRDRWNREGGTTKHERRLPVPGKRRSVCFVRDQFEKKIASISVLTASSVW
jgi:hypothetical protein